MISKLPNSSLPIVFPGNLAADDRGNLRFVNDFDFAGVKRFYQVENVSTSVIRAWHGHAKEGKYVYVTKGSLILGAVKLDDLKKPNPKAEVSRFVLSSLKPTVVYIPPGFANGFRMLEPDTTVLFFSTSSLEESKGDDYRFPADYWGTSIWETENR